MLTQKSTLKTAIIICNKNIYNDNVIIILWDKKE